ncbi:MAG: hypothetical protein J5726_07920 [Treponema sp.]|nr:hypothetical protein [Treponema sp.]
MSSKKFSLDSKPVHIILIVLCVVLTFALYMQRRTRNNYKEAAKLPFYNIQPAEVADGTYRGKVYTSFLHVQLDVTVMSGKLTQIEVVENEGLGGKQITPLLDQMLAQNNSVVAALKGDELASIVFIACVDDALFNGLPEERQSQLKKTDDE